MFPRSVSCFICIFVPVVIATDYNNSETVTGKNHTSLIGSSSGVTAYNLRTNNLTTVQNRTNPVTQRHSGRSQAPIATMLPVADHTTPSTEDATVSRMCAPAATPLPHPGTHHPHSDPGRTLLAADCTSPPGDGDPVSRLRGLSQEEKDRRLIEAAREGAVEDLRSLLIARADVWAVDEENDTALHWAASMGHVEAVQFLLEFGADVDAQNGVLFTPLHLAAGRGHLEVVNCLVMAGANVNASSNMRTTPLHWAAFKGNAAVVRLLTGSHADLNARGELERTPLHVAAYFGRAEAAAALIEAGANRAARDKNGDTPLDLAQQNNHHQLLQMLIGS